MKIVRKNSTENCHFYSREKSLYIAWACFRNGAVFSAFVYSYIFVSARLSFVYITKHAHAIYSNIYGCKNVHFQVKFFNIFSYFCSKH